MKKILVTISIYVCFFQFVFSQDGVHERVGPFSKRIEYNILNWGKGYNLNGKGNTAKRFFGNFNAPIEFIFYPSLEYWSALPSGFRIMKDSLDKAYILEAKRILNNGEVLEAVRSHIKNLEKYFEETNKLTKIDSCSFYISNQLAEKLYEKMVSIIDNFKAKGVPPNYYHGYEVTFRTVVEDEVWTLDINIPTGNARKMSDLCMQIIEDAYNKKLDEASYIKLLDNF